MYVDRIRKFIASFDEVKLDEFLEKLKIILWKNYGKALKPSHVRDRVEYFVNGGNSEIKYFEAFLLTLDEIERNGSENILFNKFTKEITWRHLLLNVTKDQALPIGLQYVLNEENMKENMKEMKAIFQNTIFFCYANSNSEFNKNLRTFNSFLKISNENSKKNYGRT